MPISIPTPAPKFSPVTPSLVISKLRPRKWTENRRVVIDQGIGIWSPHRFGGDPLLPGAVVTTPGIIKEYSLPLNSFKIDPLSEFYSLPITESPSYSIVVASDEYSAELVDVSGPSTSSLTLVTDYSAPAYSSTLTPDFNAASTYRLDTYSPTSALIGSVTLTKFLLENHVYLATMSYDGTWTLTNNNIAYYINNPLNVTNELGVFRVALVTHPDTNLYDTYPFVISTTVGQATVNVASRAETINANYVVTVGQASVTVNLSYEAQVLDLILADGSYIFPSPGQYSATLTRTAWSTINSVRVKGTSAFGTITLIL